MHSTRYMHTRDFSRCLQRALDTALYAPPSPPRSERAELQLVRLGLRPLEKDMLKVGIPLQPMECRVRALAKAAHHPLAREEGELAHNALGGVGAGVRAHNHSNMFEVQGNCAGKQT